MFIYILCFSWIPLRVTQPFNPTLPEDPCMTATSLSVRNRWIWVISCMDRRVWCSDSLFKVPVLIASSRAPWCAALKQPPSVTSSTSPVASSRAIMLDASLLCKRETWLSTIASVAKPCCALRKALLFCTSCSNSVMTIPWWSQCKRNSIVMMMMMTMIVIMRMGIIIMMDYSANIAIWCWYTF